MMPVFGSSEVFLIRYQPCVAVISTDIAGESGTEAEVQKHVSADQSELLSLSGSL